MTADSTRPAPSRPDFGLILEGHGEYAVYPSLVSRILDARALYIRPQNAGGSGTLCKRLEELLTHLVGLCHPFNVIVALDATDPLDAGLYGSCTQLCEDLCSRADRWLASATPRFDPLPLSIRTIIQVPMFETWLIADTQGLATHPAFRTITITSWANVDEEVPNPLTWLRKNSTGYFNSKRPAMLREAFALCSVLRIEQCSRSFRKLTKELRQAHAARHQ